MKALGWVAAAVLAATGVATTPAAAQPERVRVVERTKITYKTDRRGWDNRRYRGQNNWGWRTNCRNQWRSGHRERMCRKVRYRRY